MGGLRAAIAEVKKEWGDFRSDMIRRFNSLVNNLNDHKKRFDRIVIATTQRFASVQVSLEAFSQALEQLDAHSQTVARTQLEVFGRLAQIEKHLASQGFNFEDLTPSDIEEIKISAREAFEATWNNCYRIVLQMREAAIKAQREAAEKAKKEAEEAKKDEQEATRAEEELQTAESTSNLVDEPGGEGSEIPEGAEVFGG